MGWRRERRRREETSCGFSADSRSSHSLKTAIANWLKSLQCDHWESVESVRFPATEWVLQQKIRIQQLLCVSVWLCFCCLKSYNFFKSTACLCTVQKDLYGIVCVCVYVLTLHSTEAGRALLSVALPVEWFWKLVPATKVALLGRKIICVHINCTRIQSQHWVCVWGCACVCTCAVSKVLPKTVKHTKIFQSRGQICESLHSLWLVF